MAGPDLESNKNKAALKVLERAWNDKNGDIYLNRNVDSIKQHLFELGVKLDSKTIKEYLEKQRSSDVTYKNQSLRRLKETSKAHLPRSAFFAKLQADLMFLKKGKNNYGTSKKYLVVVICTLSKYVFLEATSTKTFLSQMKAMTRILTRIKAIRKDYPGGDLTSDMGGEFSSHLFRDFMQKNGITVRLVRKRPFRSSYGAAAVEAANRRVRNNLEKVMSENPRLNFEDKLQMCADMCNDQHLSSIGMTARQALDHSALRIAMISEDKRLRRSKYLREEIVSQKTREILPGTVVCVKLNQEKHFASTVKESYGTLSPYVVVISVDKSQQVYTYKVANLITLHAFSGNYTYNELKVVDISYFSALKKVELNVKRKIKVFNGLAIFEIHYFDFKLCANESILNR